MYVKLAIYKDCNKMPGQQNIKLCYCICICSEELRKNLKIVSVTFPFSQIKFFFLAITWIKNVVC